MNDSERWEQLQELFHLAKSVPTQDRASVLAASCADEDLRQLALEILKAGEGETPTDGINAESGQALAPWNVSGNNIAGSNMGPYRLVRLIGSGGIGTVYLAERLAGETLQRAALKVLAPHAAGPSFAERFKREQHILSSLDHPNITRMLDAGLSETGQPYLVMEYVEGIHLTAYCDEHRSSIEHRLRLFLQICDAIAYAHLNLVVHLDLKPSNTLVTAEGVVKLLDFGTSKLLSPDGGFTSTLMATPAYASPEQLRGEAVTTLCDLYSLGAMLFELLAGRRPGASGSVVAILDRAAREQEAERLDLAVSSEVAAARGLTQSRLSQMLRGDLATIVAKCLRLRAGDRYSSVNALSNDLRRYLDGKPVLARPQTTAYRVSKFLRRNRKAATATAAGGVLLLAALGYAGWRQRQAFEEGQRAVRMQSFLYRLFRLANSNHTGKQDATLKEFLRLSVGILPRYIPDARDLRQAQLGLAESMYDNDDFDGARPAFEAVAQSAKADGDVASQAEAEAFAGDIAYHQGRMDDGKKLTADALALSETKGVPASVRIRSEIYYAVNLENNGYRTDHILDLLKDAVKLSRGSQVTEDEHLFAIESLSDDLINRGLNVEAEPGIQEALAIEEKEPLAICQRSYLYGELGYIRDRDGKKAESLLMHQKSYDGYVQCSGAESREAITQQDYIASEMIQTGRAQEAIVLLERDLKAWRTLVGETPDLAGVLYFLSQAYVETGQWEKGARVAEEEVKLLTGKVSPSDRRIGVGEWIWARALAGQQLYSEALPHAKLADTSLSHNAVSLGAKKMAADAHALRLDVEMKAAAKNN